MSYEIRCSKCERPSSSLLDFRCPSCYQPLDVQMRIQFEVGDINRQNFTVWRYASFFPYVEETGIVTLGEGWTPLVKLPGNVCLKLENLNPTGSFKDRGSAVLVSALHGLLTEREGYISEDSSGNAGASMAAYAARAGLRATIYVPESVSGPKFSQIGFYGARVVKVSGSRSHVAEEAQKIEQGKFYVGHILHPLFRDGIRSLAYELVEQLDWHLPERIYLPVSAGTLLLGVIAGLSHLLESNVIDVMPRIVACQTRQVSPLYHRFKNLTYKVPEKVVSVADALVSVNPPLLDLMAERLREAGGDVALVEEDEILSAFKKLARLGFFVEPSSAVAYAACDKQLEEGEISGDDQTAIVLTGSGLKTALKPSKLRPE